MKEQVARNLWNTIETVLISREEVDNYVEGTKSHKDAICKYEQNYMTLLKEFQKVTGYKFTCSTSSAL